MKSVNDAGEQGRAGEPGAGGGASPGSGGGEVTLLVARGPRGGAGGNLLLAAARSAESLSELTSLEKQAREGRVVVKYDPTETVSYRLLEKALKDQARAPETLDPARALGAAMEASMTGGSVLKAIKQNMYSKSVSLKALGEAFLAGAASAGEALLLAPKQAIDVLTHGWSGVKEAVKETLKTLETPVGAAYAAGQAAVLAAVGSLVPKPELVEAEPIETLYRMPRLKTTLEAPGGGRLSIEEGEMLVRVRAKPVDEAAVRVASILEKSLVEKNPLDSGARFYRRVRLQELTPEGATRVGVVKLAGRTGAGEAVAGDTSVLEALYKPVAREGDLVRIEYRIKRLVHGSPRQPSLRDAGPGDQLIIHRRLEALLLRKRRVLPPKKITVERDYTAPLEPIGRSLEPAGSGGEVELKPMKPVSGEPSGEAGGEAGGLGELVKPAEERAGEKPPAEKPQASKSSGGETVFTGGTVQQALEARAVEAGAVEPDYIYIMTEEPSLEAGGLLASALEPMSLAGARVGGGVRSSSRSPLGERLEGSACLKPLEKLFEDAGSLVRVDVKRFIKHEWRSGERLGGRVKPVLPEPRPIPEPQPLVTVVEPRLKPKPEVVEPLPTVTWHPPRQRLYPRGGQGSLEKPVFRESTRGSSRSGSRSESVLERVMDQLGASEAPPPRLEWRLRPRPRWRPVIRPEKRRRSRRRLVVDVYKLLEFGAPDIRRWI